VVRHTSPLSAGSRLLAELARRAPLLRTVRKNLAAAQGDIGRPAHDE
jgi:hypothetical protein